MTFEQFTEAMSKTTILPASEEEQKDHNRIFEMVEEDLEEGE